jgi:hypothetical protein
VIADTAALDPVYGLESGTSLCGKQGRIARDVGGTKSGVFRTVPSPQRPRGFPIATE